MSNVVRSIPELKSLIEREGDYFRHVPFKMHIDGKWKDIELVVGFACGGHQNPICVSIKTIPLIKSFVCDHCGGAVEDTGCRLLISPSIEVWNCRECFHIYHRKQGESEFRDEGRKFNKWAEQEELKKMLAARHAEDRPMKPRGERVFLKIVSRDKYKEEQEENGL